MSDEPFTDDTGTVWFPLLGAHGIRLEVEQGVVDLRGEFDPLGELDDGDWLAFRLVSDPIPEAPDDR